jgi:hypothetical protein
MNINNSAENLLHIFANKQRTIEDQAAHFIPPKASTAVEIYLKQVKTNLATLCTNITHDTEFRTLSRKIHNTWNTFYTTATHLKQRDDIVIYPADKNMGPAVLSRDFYIRTGESAKHLGDVTAYTPLDDSELNIDSRYKQLHSIMLRQQWLSKKVANTLHEDFISNRALVTPCKAYFLPKVHKEDHKENLSLRLICSSCSWLTYMPSKYIAFALKPILVNLPSYIENSAALVKRLDALKTSVYVQLCTADVCTLYPSIIIADGLRSLKCTLSSKQWSEEHIKFILELTSWVLYNNVLMFNGKLYIQIKGTAMGTPLAVAYACIHMYVIEQESFDIFAKRGYSLRSILLYVRFIDDVFLIVENYEIAKLLLDIINGRRPTIRLEFSIKNTSVDFLDVTIYKADKIANLQVKLFQKPGNKFLFLPPMSFHPPHIYKGWIRGYIQRMRLNCSLNTEFDIALTKFRNHLESRGYTNIHLDAPFQSLPLRQDLLNKDEPKRSFTGIPFITTFTAEVKYVKKELSLALTAPPGLELHPDIEYILDNKARPLLSLSREKNIREMLVSTKLVT